MNYKEFCEFAENNNGTLGRVEECPSSFILWHPKLPRYLTQGELDEILAGEVVLWSGRTDRAFLRKSHQRRKLATIITLIITIMFALWPMGLVEAITFWLCFGIWPIGIAISLLKELRHYRHNYYVITPTRVIFIRDEEYYDMQIKDIISWRVDSKVKSIGTIYLEDGILPDNYLYKIKGFSYVKHLLLSLIASASAPSGKFSPDVHRLNYCPQCGYNLG